MNTYGYVGGDVLKNTDSKGLLPDSVRITCARNPELCYELSEIPASIIVPSTSEIRVISQSSEIIAKGRNIRKVEELCEKFGGKARDWVKKKGWDSNKQEWHYYENKGQKIGWKRAGEVDPF